MTDQPTDHRASTAARFWAKVQGGDYTECWIWTASTVKGEYGKFRYGTTMVIAHRWAYEYLIAPIPPDLYLDHLCRTPRCVNPWHLEPVTNDINVARGERPKRTHCPHGHEYTPENTYWHGVNRNQRSCRECTRQANRRKYRQRREQAAA